MIAYLKGTVLDFSEKHVLVVTSGGVGYEIMCPTSSLVALPKKQQETEFFIHTVVSEKAIDLYGFPSSEERDVFRTLISIDKLGPKKAIAILSMFRPEHLREIAFREDDKTLATVPGIGIKSAKQILWFLRDKIEGLATSSRKGSMSTPAHNQYFDALAGLKNLGYSEDEARPLVKQLFENEPDMDAAGAIRLALKHIAEAKKN